MDIDIEAKPISWSKFIQFFKELEKIAQDTDQVSVKVFTRGESITLSVNVGNNYSVLGMKSA